MNNNRNIISKSWVFDKKVAKKFDEHVAQSVPFYSNFQKHIAKLSEFFLKDGAVIYDIGCSTGNTIKEICKLKVKRKTTIIGIDKSKTMIKIAKIKLSKYKKFNIKLLSSDIEKYKFGKCNLVISVLIFPFLTLKQRKIILKKIYNKLEIGGALITIEKVRSDTGIMEDILNQLYFDFKQEKNLSGNDILRKAKSLRTAFNIYDQTQTIRFLQNSKFKKIDIFFNKFNFVGIIAIK